MGFLESLRRELPALFQPKPPSKRGAGPFARIPGNTIVRPPVVRQPGYPDAVLTGIDRKKGGEIIKGRIESISSSMGLEYGRVFIKDQKTLWASCSGKKNLNFNWRLAAAPPEILDYVVIHELCHLREMNHSKRFWHLVGESCPDYKARRRWLRDNAALLRAPRPAAWN